MSDYLRAVRQSNQAISALRSAVAEGMMRAIDQEIMGVLGIPVMFITRRPIRLGGSTVIAEMRIGRGERRAL